MQMLLKLCLATPQGVCYEDPPVREMYARYRPKNPKRPVEELRRHRFAYECVSLIAFRDALVGIHDEPEYERVRKLKDHLKTHESGAKYEKAVKEVWNKDVAFVLCRTLHVFPPLKFDGTRLRADFGEEGASFLTRLVAKPSLATLARVIVHGNVGGDRLLHGGSKTLFFGFGVTPFAVAREVARHLGDFAGNVFTTNFEVAGLFHRLHRYGHNFNLCLAGGRKVGAPTGVAWTKVEWSTGAIVPLKDTDVPSKDTGVPSKEPVRKLDVAVVSFDHIDGTGSFISQNDDLAEVTTGVLRAAQRVILVADSTKFNSSESGDPIHLPDDYPARGCYLVTDAAPPKGWAFPRGKNWKAEEKEVVIDASHPSVVRALIDAGLAPDGQPSPDSVAAQDDTGYTATRRPPWQTDEGRPANLLKLAKPPRKPRAPKKPKSELPFDDRFLEPG
jgi:hypothetical protein